MLRAVAMFVAGLALISPFPAQAEEYPARPVKLIVPFAAGGPADIYARFLAQRLEVAFAQPFVVDDRPGAGAVRGTDVASKRALCVAARFRSNRAGELFRPGAGSASLGRSEQSRRAARAREVEARQAQLRLIRAGNALSHGGRAVQGDGGA